MFNLIQTAVMTQALFGWATKLCVMFNLIQTAVMTQALFGW